MSLRLERDNKAVTGRVFLAALIMILMCLGLGGSIYLAQASSILMGGRDWFSNESDLLPEDISTADFDELYYQQPGCIMESVVLQADSSAEPISATSCVVRGQNVRLTVDARHEYYISTVDDSRFYRVSNIRIRNHIVRLQPESNRFIVIVPLEYWTKQENISLFEDITSQLQRQPDGSYHLDVSAPANFPGTDDPALTTKGYGLSPNGEYLVYGRNHSDSVAGDRITKVNLETGSHTIIGIGYKAVWWQPGISEYAISDSGDYIVSNGFVWDARGCGVDIADDERRMASPCLKKRQYLCGNELGCNHQRVWFEGEYKFKILHNSSIATYAANGHGQPRLEYLAMGDSYSSGEGDIGRRPDGSSYYMAGTAGLGECHLSTRSYPFLLRTAWGIPSGGMRSVACSGAQILPDYYGRLEGYLGQGKRLAERTNIAHVQDVALRDFIPGHIPQIEFVRKYQPKVVTLTGGGNDVGFQRILEACAVPRGADYVFAPVINACSYAKEGSGAHTALLGSIDTQYHITKRLIESIKSVSPDSKIIIVGYPSFVHDGRSACVPASVGNLNEVERKMINSMTTRLNQVLQRAAHDSGVSFVDIEGSLVGGRLCEGSEYMTGVWDGIMRRAVGQERFHPNAEGHKQIAQAIQASGVYEAENIPGPGDFNPLDDFITTLRKAVIKGSTIVRGALVKLEVDSGNFASGSTYTATIYSTPHQLGTFRTKADGSISQDVSFEGVAPGYHMLLLEGVGVDGEPLKIYQFIEVHASKDDADGDGIPNDEDRCNFIAHIYDDSGEDVCAGGLREGFVGANMPDGVPIANQRNNHETNPLVDNQPEVLVSSSKDPQEVTAVDGQQQPEAPHGRTLFAAIMAGFAIVGFSIAIIWRHNRAKASAEN